MEDLSEAEIRYFPIDFDSVHKGQTWTPDALERLTERTCGTDAYRLAVLALRERIVRECRDRGNYFTVAIVKACLRVLTDEEAALYNARTFRAGFRRSGKSLKRLLRVDATQLTEQQKMEHERSCLVFGKMLQAANSARAKISATPYERTTPGLPIRSVN